MRETGRNNQPNGKLRHCVKVNKSSGDMRRENSQRLDVSRAHDKLLSMAPIEIEGPLPDSESGGVPDLLLADIASWRL